MEEQPANMAIENGTIDFNSETPVQCNRCGGRIRKEIVNVRCIKKHDGSYTTCFDTSIMCDCRVLGKNMADYKTGGQISEDWIEDDE